MPRTFLPWDDDQAPDNGPEPLTPLEKRGMRFGRLSSNVYQSPWQKQLAPDYLFDEEKTQIFYNQLQQEGVFNGAQARYTHVQREGQYQEPVIELTTGAGVGQRRTEIGVDRWGNRFVRNAEGDRDFQYMLTHQATPVYGESGNLAGMKVQSSAAWLKDVIQSGRSPIAEIIGKRPEDAGDEYEARFGIGMRATGVPASMRAGYRNAITLTEASYQSQKNEQWDWLVKQGSVPVQGLRGSSTINTSDYLLPSYGGRTLVSGQHALANTVGLDAEGKYSATGKDEKRLANMGFRVRGEYFGQERLTGRIQFQQGVQQSGSVIPTVIGYTSATLGEGQSFIRSDYASIDWHTVDIPKERMPFAAGSFFANRAIGDRRPEEGNTLRAWEQATGLRVGNNQGIVLGSVEEGDRAGYTRVRYGTINTAIVNKDFGAKDFEERADPAFFAQFGAFKLPENLAGVGAEHAHRYRALSDKTPIHQAIRAYNTEMTIASNITGDDRLIQRDLYAATRSQRRQMLADLRASGKIGVAEARAALRSAGLQGQYTEDQTTGGLIINPAAMPYLQEHALNKFMGRFQYNERLVKMSAETFEMYNPGQLAQINALDRGKMSLQEFNARRAAIAASGTQMRAGTSLLGAAQGEGELKPALEYMGVDASGRIDAIERTYVANFLEMGDPRSMPSRSMTTIGRETLSNISSSNPGLGMALRRIDKAGITANYSRDILLADLATRSGDESLITRQGYNIRDISQLPDYEKYAAQVDPNREMTPAGRGKALLDAMSKDNPELARNTFWKMQVGDKAAYAPTLGAMANTAVVNEHTGELSHNMAGALSDVMAQQANARYMSGEAMDDRLRAARGTLAQQIVEAAGQASTQDTGTGTVLPNLGGVAATIEGIPSNAIVASIRDMSRKTGISESMLREMTRYDEQGNFVKTRLNQGREFGLSVIRDPEANPEVTALSGRVMWQEDLLRKDREAWVKRGLPTEQLSSPLISRMMMGALTGDFDADRDKILPNYMANARGEIYGANVRMRSAEELAQIAANSPGSETVSQGEKFRGAFDSSRITKWRELARPENRLPVSAMQQAIFGASKGNESIGVVYNTLHRQAHPALRGLLREARGAYAGTGAFDAAKGVTRSQTAAMGVLAQFGYQNLLDKASGGEAPPSLQLINALKNARYADSLDKQGRSTIYDPHAPEGQRKSQAFETVNQMAGEMLRRGMRYGAELPEFGTAIAPQLARAILPTSALMADDGEQRLAAAQAAVTGFAGGSMDWNTASAAIRGAASTEGNVFENDYQLAAGVTADSPMQNRSPLGSTLWGAAAYNATQPRTFNGETTPGMPVQGREAVLADWYGKSIARSEAMQTRHNMSEGRRQAVGAAHERIATMNAGLDPNMQHLRGIFGTSNAVESAANMMDALSRATPPGAGQLQQDLAQIQPGIEAAMSAGSASGGGRKPPRVLASSLFGGGRRRHSDEPSGERSTGGNTIHRYTGPVTQINQQQNISTRPVGGREARAAMVAAEQMFQPVTEQDVALTGYSANAIGMTRFEALAEAAARWGADPSAFTTGQTEALGQSLAQYNRVMQMRGQVSQREKLAAAGKGIRLQPHENVLASVLRGGSVDNVLASMGPEDARTAAMFVAEARMSGDRQSAKRQSPIVEQAQALDSIKNFASTLDLSTDALKKNIEGNLDFKKALQQSVETFDKFKTSIGELRAQQIHGGGKLPDHVAAKLGPLASGGQLNESVIGKLLGDIQGPRDAMYKALYAKTPGEVAVEQRYRLRQGGAAGRTAREHELEDPDSQLFRTKDGKRWTREQTEGAATRSQFAGNLISPETLWQMRMVSGMTINPIRGAMSGYEDRVATRHMAMAQAGTISAADLMAGEYGRIRRRQVGWEESQEAFGQQAARAWGWASNSFLGRDLMQGPIGALGAIGLPAAGVGILGQRIAQPLVESGNARLAGIGGALPFVGAAATALVGAASYVGAASQDFAAQGRAQQAMERSGSIFGALGADFGGTIGLIAQDLRRTVGIDDTDTRRSRFSGEMMELSRRVAAGEMTLDEASAHRFVVGDNVTLRPGAQIASRTLPQLGIWEPRPGTRADGEPQLPTLNFPAGVVGEQSIVIGEASISVERVDGESSNVTTSQETVSAGELYGRGYIAQQAATLWMRDMAGRYGFSQETDPALYNLYRSTHFYTQGGIQGRPLDTMAEMAMMGEQDFIGFGRSRARAEGIAFANESGQEAALVANVERYDRLISERGWGYERAREYIAQSDELRGRYNPMLRFAGMAPISEAQSERILATDGAEELLGIVAGSAAQQAAASPFGAGVLQRGVIAYAGIGDVSLTNQYARAAGWDQSLGATSAAVTAAGAGDANARLAQGRALQDTLQGLGMTPAMQIAPQYMAGAQSLYARGWWEGNPALQYFDAARYSENYAYSAARGDDPGNWAARNLMMSGEALTFANLQASSSAVVTGLSSGSLDPEVQERATLAAPRYAQANYWRRFGGGNNVQFGALSLAEQQAWTREDTGGALGQYYQFAGETSARFGRGYDEGAPVYQMALGGIQQMMMNPSTFGQGTMAMGQMQQTIGMGMGWTAAGMDWSQMLNISGAAANLTGQQFNLFSSIGGGNPYAISANMPLVAGSGISMAPIDMSSGLPTLYDRVTPQQWSMIQSRDAEYNIARGYDSRLSGVSYEEVQGGIYGLQSQIQDEQFRMIGYSAAMGNYMRNTGLALQMGGGQIGAGGFMVGGDGLSGAARLFGQQGFGLNVGNGMGFWQIEDRMTMIGREKQDFQMGQQARNLDLGQQNQDLQIRQFNEKWNLGYSKFQFETGFQRQEMMIGREQQLQSREWQQEDMAFSRNMSELSFGWQMEDFDRSIRYARGRDRRNMLRQQERATVQFSMQMSQTDRQEERFKTQSEWADQEFERKRQHFERSVQFQEEELQMQKRHFEERIGMDQERLNMQREAFEKEKGWLKETRELEDQKRLLERQQAVWNVEMQNRMANATAGSQKKIAEWQRAISLLNEVQTRENATTNLAVATGKMHEAVLRNLAIESGKAADEGGRLTEVVRQLMDTFLQQGAVAASQTQQTAPAKGAAPSLNAVGGFIQRGNATASMLSNNPPLPGYSSGGYTGDLPRNQVAGVTHGGEYVVPQNGTLVVRGEPSQQVALLVEIRDVLKDILALGPGRVNAVINTRESQVRAGDLLNAAYRH